MNLEPIRKTINAEIAKLSHVLRVLDSAGGKHTKAVKRGTRHKISAAGRKRIAAAQRARWAKIRAGKK